MTGPPIRAVLLVGSAKPEGASTSEALGRYLLDRLAAEGGSTQLFLVNHVRDERHMRELLAALAAADLFILCSPVYVDSLPSLVVRAFEQIASRRPSPASATRFVAVLNCGFPEARHCRAALEICRIFSRRAGLSWAGGLALGGGEIIHGTALDKAGPVARRVRQALDMTAAALRSGADVPDAAVKTIARPLVPTQMYTLLSNFGWRQKGRKNHVAGQLGATPFAPRS